MRLSRIALVTILGDVCSLSTYVMHNPAKDGLNRHYLYEMNGYEMDTYERLKNSS